MTSISASFMEHGRHVEFATLSMRDHDTGLGVGFLRGFRDESDTVSTPHRPTLPVLIF